MVQKAQAEEASRRAAELAASAKDASMLETARLAAADAARIYAKINAEEEELRRAAAEQAEMAAQRASAEVRRAAQAEAEWLAAEAEAEARRAAEMDEAMRQSAELQKAEQQKAQQKAAGEMKLALSGAVSQLVGKSAEVQTAKPEPGLKEMEAPAAETMKIPMIEVTQHSEGDAEEAKEVYTGMDPIVSEAGQPAAVQTTHVDAPTDEPVNVALDMIFDAFVEAAAEAPEDLPCVEGLTSVAGAKPLITDKQCKAEVVKKLLSYLLEHGYERQITLKELSTPTQSDFVSVVSFLLKKAKPDLKFNGRFEEDVPLVLKSLGYSIPIGKSHLLSVGSAASWPHALAALNWLVDLLTEREANGEAPMEMRPQLVEPEPEPDQMAVEQAAEDTVVVAVEGQGVRSRPISTPVAKRTRNASRIPVRGLI